MRQEPKNSGNALEDGIETESRLQKSEVMTLAEEENV